MLFSKEEYSLTYVACKEENGNIGNVVKWLSDITKIESLESFDGTPVTFGEGSLSQVLSFTEETIRIYNYAIHLGEWEVPAADIGNAALCKVFNFYSNLIIHLVP